MSGCATAHRGRLLDEWPLLPDKREIAGPPVMAFERPGNDGRLIDGWSFPLGPTIDRVFVKPVHVLSVAAAYRRQPLAHASAGFGVPCAIERAGRANGIARPAVRGDPALVPARNRAKFGVGVDAGRERRTA